MVGCDEASWRKTIPLLGGRPHARSQAAHAEAHHRCNAAARSSNLHRRHTTSQVHPAPRLQCTHRESTCTRSVIQQSRWLATEQLGVSHCLCIHTGASGSKWVVRGESSDDCGSCSSCNAQRRSFGNPCPGISRTCCNSSRSNPLTAKRHRCSTSPIFGRQTLQNCQTVDGESGPCTCERTRR